MSPATPEQLRESVLSGMHALLITNIPTPYRIPLFRELAAQLSARGTTLKVVFGARGYARRKWQVDLHDCGFDYEVLPSRTFTIGRSESASFTYPGLRQLLARERPDAIVVTGYSPATLKLWLRSWIADVPYVIWSGTIASPFERVSWVRTIARRLLVGRARAFVAYGSRARDYLQSLGAAPDRIHVAINTVETEFFERETRERRRGPAGPGFLYVGNFTPGKRLDLLLDAFARVAAARGEPRLTMVGDGPSREALALQAAALGIAGRVSFEGYRQRHEIPDYLARARCFVFPSEYDIWGLVLVEAMAAGLPCLASVYAGATADLVEDGVTGYRADFGDVERTANIMLKMVDNPELAARIGAAATEFVRTRASLSVSAAGLVAAIGAAAGLPAGELGAR